MKEWKNERIKNRYKKIYNKDLNLKVKIIDSSIENAIIFNDNLIVVTYALLKKSSKDVIEGVLAHEVGHYHNGDTKFNQLNFINSVVSKNVESGVIINAIMFFISIFTTKKPRPLGAGCLCKAFFMCQSTAAY